MKNTQITIDDIASLFVSEKGGSREAVIAEIEQLLADINALKVGEEVSLDGFGTFKEGPVGLLFEPSEKLKIELNYAYAGMQSVVLSPPTKEIAALPIADVSDRGDETDVEDTSEAAFESDELIQVVEDDTEEAAENFDMDGYEKVISDFGIEADEDEDEDPKKITPDKRPEEKADDVATEEIQPPKQEEPAEEPEDEETIAEESTPKEDGKSEKAALLLVDEFNEAQKKKEPVKKVTEPPEETENETTESLEQSTSTQHDEEKEPANKKGAIAAVVLIAAVVVLAIMAVIIFNNLDDTDVVVAEPEAQTETEAEAPLSSADITFPVQPEMFQSEDVEAEQADLVEEPEQNESSVSEQSEDDLAEEIESIEQDTSPELDTLPVYGLQGTINESISSYFSIILMSVPQESAARDFAEDLANEGYRSFAYRAELENNRSTWRVGIGQFETVSDAVNVAAGLPEPYRSNHFVVRIN